MNKFTKLSLWGAIFLTAGCSSEVFHQFTIDGTPAHSLSIDARQRVILVTDRGGPTHDKKVTCAEPSPDAIATIAASGTATLPGKGEPLAKIDSKSNEELGLLVRRTSTIQLLRDGLFRVCEAYMNGVIDQNLYKQVVFMYDDMVITLLAIDQLSQEGRGNDVPIQSAPSPSQTSSNSNASERGSNAAVIRQIVNDYLTNQMTLYEWFWKPRSGANLSPSQQKD